MSVPSSVSVSVSVPVSVSVTNVAVSVSVSGQLSLISVHCNKVEALSSRCLQLTFLTAC